MYYINTQGMPHVCGDEPLNVLSSRKNRLYAPRMWG